MAYIVPTSNSVPGTAGSAIPGSPLVPGQVIQGAVPHNAVAMANANPGTDYLRLYAPNVDSTTNLPGAGKIAGKYPGPINAGNYANIGSGTADDRLAAGFNQLMMEVSQHFDPMLQISIMQQPRFWHDRIPRSAYPLFNGTVHETRIFRGALYTYAGLGDWNDINPYPTSSNNPCGASGYETPSVGWEALSWRGKKRYWGSDPICVEQFKFYDQAKEQLAWILRAGAENGIQIQEVWNRDMFIYQAVNFKRAFVMTSEYTGSSTGARWYYNPFIKFDQASSSTATEGHGVTGGLATATGVSTLADGPFVLIDDVDIEPVNFDILDKVRASLEIRCRDAAVSSAGGSAIFGIALSHDDVEKYVRGNEEERKYWIEAKPQALIDHYDFTTPVFRRWSIINDGNQLRLHRVARIELSETNAKLLGVYDTEYYAHVNGKTVWVCVPVDPFRASTDRVGVGGSPIPEDNPEYIDAELAIAPVFMNQLFENQFVPAITSLGSGTSFGPTPGLNGVWTWMNIRDRETNPFGEVGNFVGKFEIVPKPNKNVFHAISFLYRRCTVALPSYCPTQNKRINPILTSTTVLSEKTTVASGKTEATLKTEGMLNVVPGDEVSIGGTKAVVYAVPTPRQLMVQLAAAAGEGGVTFAKGAEVVLYTESDDESSISD